jgi:hypothetical protein
LGKKGGGPKPGDQRIDRIGLLLSRNCCIA